MIRSIAIDDEPFALDVISIHAAKVPELELVSTFTDPAKALEYLKNNRVDLVFLDINMPGMSGMELVKKLHTPPRIIFTTAYSEYALDSYDYDAVDYLLKPIEFDRFHRAIQRYLKQAVNGNGRGQPAPQTHLFVKDGYRQVRLIINDIRYVQSEGNYLNIVTGTGRTVARMTMTQMEALLPAGLFARVHNSWLAGISHIDRIENNHVYCGDASIPIGEKYREEFYRRIGTE